MNRLDITTTVDTMLENNVRVLSVQELVGWSADDFALAVALAKAPAAFRSGLGDGFIHMVVAVDAADDAIACLPIQIGDEELTLGLGRVALDQLVGLLGEKKLFGASATLSLDAIEALCVAILSPLDRIEVSQASWNSMGQTIAALTLNETPIFLSGRTAALRAFHNTVMAANASEPSPFTSMKQPPRQRLAVATQSVFGVVDLQPADLAVIEPGCGIKLDTFWPHGLHIVGRRFAWAEGTWHARPEVGAASHHVCSVARLQMLDELTLGADESASPPANLKLMEGGQVIAHGQLVSIEISGAVDVLFEVDQLT